MPNVKLSLPRALDFSGVLETSKGKVCCRARAEWIVLTLLLMSSSLIFMYVDLPNTFDNSILFLDAVFTGQFLDFYQYSIDHANTSFAANYSIYVYIIYGIWDLPIWAARHFFGFDYLSSSFALLWCKLLGVVCAIVSAFVVSMITRELGASHDRSRFAVFLYFSSFFLYIPVFLLAQVDGPALLLMLLGFYYYLQGSMKKFVLFYILAIPLKVFALLIFIPLILLREKGVLKAVGLIALSMVLVVFEKVLFGSSDAYNLALAPQNHDAIELILASSTPLGNEQLMFVACYIALCLFCFTQNGKTEVDEKKFALFACLAVWVVFTVFLPIRSYWIIFLAPFSTIAIAVSGKYLKLAVLLESLSGISFALYISVVNYSFDEPLLSQLLLHHICEIPSESTALFGSFRRMLEIADFSQYAPLCVTVFSASLVGLLILTSPFMSQEVSSRLHRGFLWLRIILLAGFTAGVLYGYLATGNEIQFSNIDQRKIPSQVNLIDPDKENRLKQNIVFEEDIKLNELVIRFDNTASTRGNFGSVCVQLIDESIGEPIFYKRIGVAEIASDEDYRIGLNGTPVLADHLYSIELFGMKDIEFRKADAIKPYVTYEGVKESQPAELNSMRQNYSLYYSIR